MLLGHTDPQAAHERHMPSTAAHSVRIRGALPARGSSILRCLAHPPRFDRVTFA